MSKIALSSNALGTGTLTIASPNTNTDRTLTLPDNTGTLLSTASTSVLPKGVPLFSASAGSAQSVITNTITKIVAPTVGVDTAGRYDSGLSRYTPNVAGYYLFTQDIQLTSAGFASVFITYFYKNAVIFEVYVAPATYNFIHASVSKTFYMNGTTDYMEIAAQQLSGASQTLRCVDFQGVLVRAD